MAIHDDGLSPEAMLAFYQRLYPFKSIFHWLNHEPVPTRLFVNREFAFTLQGDVYLRYNSFTNADELKKQVCTLNPTRFEIGPVYSARPRDKKTVRPTAFKPLQRELVFDIDMTDYDSVRRCCSEANICSRCRVFISAAVKVLDRSIRDQFGYTHLLWVYSGRRGIHLWVSDQEAMELSDEERRAVANYLTVVGGGKETKKKVNVRQGSKPLPPGIQEFINLLQEIFPPLILQDQDCFAGEAGAEELLALLPANAQIESLRKKWTTDPDRSSEEKWDDIRNQVKIHGKKTPPGKLLLAAMEDIVLQYTWPRIDAEVSKHRNHLLKAPFCVHPKTGRVCVPVDPTRIEEFDPAKVPTVGQLLNEIDEAMVINNEDGAEGVQHLPDWEKTSLKPYVGLLDAHNKALMEEARRKKRGDRNTDVTTSW